LIKHTYHRSCRVTISNPTAFFGLFDGDAADTGSARNTYFGNLGSKKKVLSVESVDLAESAFKLLQWAQYGDVPDFKQSETKLQATQATQEDSDDGELLDESAFETEDGKRPDTWAKDFIEASSKDPIADLPVMANPEGLQVTLRPYQGQALSWMWKRETDHGNRELVEKELMLLSELARNKAKSNSSYVDVYNVDEKEVSCECGPVVVSKEGAAKSSTVGGEINPVTHPLWQRRFLARDNLSSAVSFYVSELLGIASATPPRPPQLCVGGIEADSMGLGKTVMLLALLLKSKQEEKPTFPDEVYRTTLVVAPLSLISQWEEELASKTNLQYKVFYADSRIVVSKQSFCGVDVVLTTCKLLCD
jgi:SNF2 family DNA or RNA helicase